MNADSRKILVVDDEPLNLELIEEYLDMAGYESQCVLSGAEAIAALEASHEQFCCILLDRMMPEMDGIEVLKKIKQHSEWSALPVIMQTALSGTENMQEGLQAGAYYYLTKPYDRDTFTTIVDSAAGSYRRYCQLQQALRKTSQTLKLLQRGRFVYRSLDEARDLAVLLAGLCPQADNAVLGLSEILINAVEHGNLEIGYEEKSRLNEQGRLMEEIEHRLASEAYGGRQVEVEFENRSGRLCFTVRDEGKGFDWKPYMDISPERALNSHGRGIALSRALSFDEIEYSGNGNTVKLVIHERMQ